MAGKSNLHYLESLRGIAAFVVFLSHLRLTFWPSFCPALLASGSVAVRLFFVLSGFVLSISYFRKQTRSVVLLAAAKRYPRLMLPVCAAVLAAWLALQLGTVKTTQAATLMKQDPGSWLFQEPSQPVSFAHALFQGTIGTFIHQERADTLKSSLNSSLWTMPIELAGSFFIFALLGVDSFLARRWLLYLPVGLFWAVLPYHFSMYGLDFLAGIALCDFFISRETSGRKIELSAAVALTLFFVGIALAGTTVLHMFDDKPDWKSRLLAKSSTIGCVLIVAASSFSSALRGILEHSVFSLLGRLSFPLYLFHTTILGSLGCGTYLALRAVLLSHGPAAALAGVLSTGASLLVAFVAYYLVERPAIRFADRFGRLILAPFLPSLARKAVPV